MTFFLHFRYVPRTLQKFDHNHQLQIQANSENKLESEDIGSIKSV